MAFQDFLGQAARGTGNFLLDTLRGRDSDYYQRERAAQFQKLLEANRASEAKRAFTTLSAAQQELARQFDRPYGDNGLTAAQRQDQSNTNRAFTQLSKPQQEQARQFGLSLKEQSRQADQPYQNATVADRMRNDAVMAQLAEQIRQHGTMSAAQSAENANETTRNSNWLSANAMGNKKDLILGGAVPMSPGLGREFSISDMNAPGLPSNLRRLLPNGQPLPENLRTPETIAPLTESVRGELPDPRLGMVGPGDPQMRGLANAVGLPEQIRLSNERQSARGGESALSNLPSALFDRNVTPLLQLLMSNKSAQQVKKGVGRGYRSTLKPWLHAGPGSAWGWLGNQITPQGQRF